MSSDAERLLPPNEPAAFESLCLDLWREIWGDFAAQKNGRSGQPQAGVDIFGRADGIQVGVQCKRKDGLVRSALSVRELEKEVAKARGFVPRLGRFIVATSGPRDVTVQERARELSRPGFDVQVWSWEDIWHELYQRRKLLARILPIYWPMQAAVRGRRVTPSRLRHATGRLFGRQADLAALDAAWDNPAVNVITIVAWGGVGKTTLVSTWVAALAAREHDGADYFDWSFYSQGTREQGGASADAFIDTALRIFGDEATADSARSPWDKGSRLAQLVAEQRTLLVLDGLEPLQHPPGPLAGELKDPAMIALLKGLAGRNAGLCVVTTRERVKDLIAFEESTARRRNLERLSSEAGIDLLNSLGVHGPAADLQKLVEEVQGHPLTLDLLGGFLHDAHGGDVRRRDVVRFEEADAEIQGGHAFRVMGAYEKWFASEGEKGKRLLAVLHLVGLFDRPAATGLLAVLRRPPVIPGLTDVIAGLSDPQWNLAVSRLAECGLVRPGDDVLDAHPLVREHFGRRLSERNPVAWKTAHGRLFDYLTGAGEYQPETLAGLQPLYQAVVHGCEAGREHEACTEVYYERILRGTGIDGYFSMRRLGAVAADLGAIACFFEVPWTHVSPAFAEPDQAWLQSEAAFRLRALGRLKEALEPMRIALARRIQAESWRGAGIVASNLSDMELAMGEVAGAVRDAERSLVFADNSGDAFVRMGCLAGLAHAMHQAGRREDALASFHDAEVVQARRQPEYPLLISVQGFRYCDLLLTAAERAAAGGQATRGAREACAEVWRRGLWMFEWHTPNDSILDIALDHLSLGRVLLYRAILEASAIKTAEADVEQAVSYLRRGGRQDYLPQGLFTRAWLYSALGRADAARADLAEAREIAQRGPMPLLLADVHLYRARLFRDRVALAEARWLVDKHRYYRRREELADLEAIADGW